MNDLFSVKGKVAEAVNQLPRVLAQRLATRHITVNAIAPGPFPSKMMKKVIEEKGDAMRDRAPLGRLGEPGDMAGEITYLSSRVSAYVAGQVIAVDGFSARPW